MKPHTFVCKESNLHHVLQFKGLTLEQRRPIRLVREQTANCIKDLNALRAEVTRAVANDFGTQCCGKIPRSPKGDLFSAWEQRQYGHDFHFPTGNAPEIGGGVRSFLAEET